MSRSRLRRLLTASMVLLLLALLSSSSSSSSSSAASASGERACPSTVTTFFADARFGYQTCVDELRVRRVSATLAWALTSNRSDAICANLNCTSALRLVLDAVGDDDCAVQADARGATFVIDVADLRRLGRNCAAVLYPAKTQRPSTIQADKDDHITLMFFLWSAVGFLSFVYIVGWATRHKWYCSDVEAAFCACCRDDKFEEDEEQHQQGEEEERDLENILIAGDAASERTRGATPFQLMPPMPPRQAPSMARPGRLQVSLTDRSHV